MRRFLKPTIRDVASRAGVSTATVSYFVNGREGVCSPETADRIRNAIAELHYTPNSLSRGLLSRTTNTFGLYMMAPVAEDNGSSFFLERLWRGIMREADAADYAVLHYQKSIRQATTADPFLDGRVDGLLIHPLDDGRWARLAAAGMPTVLMTRSYNIPDGCGAAWTDETQTIHLALSHLWELGHRRIAHVAGPVGDLTSVTGRKPDPGEKVWGPTDIAVARVEAFRTWLAICGALDDQLIDRAGGWAGRRAQQIVQLWRTMAQPPTAVVCANDAIALDIAVAARMAGLSIPGDLSIVGIDNAPHSRDGGPALTSVEIPVEDLGAESVRTLLRLMQGAPIDQCRTPVPVTSIVVRESTGPPPTSSRS